MKGQTPTIVDALMSDTFSTLKIMPRVNVHQIPFPLMRAVSTAFMISSYNKDIAFGQNTYN